MGPFLPVASLIWRWQLAGFLPVTNLFSTLFSSVGPWPEHFLRVDSFQPLLTKNGPPRDMISTVSLLHGDQLLVRGTVQINQPLLYKGIVITPVSFSRQPSGFQAMLAGNRPVQLKAGQRFKLADGSSLEVFRFLPDSRRTQSGEIVYRRDRLGDPAFELRWSASRQKTWQGWYFARQPLPRELSSQGVHLRLIAPTYTDYSTLTVNYDPGAG